MRRNDVDINESLLPKSFFGTSDSWLQFVVPKYSSSLLPKSFNIYSAYILHYTAYVPHIYRLYTALILLNYRPSLRMRLKTINSRSCPTCPATYAIASWRCRSTFR